MTITITNTSKIVTINGVPARIWEGTTNTGIEVHAFITRIAIDSREERKEEFDAELLQQVPPSVNTMHYAEHLLIE